MPSLDYCIGGKLRIWRDQGLIMVILINSVKC